MTVTTDAVTGRYADYTEINMQPGDDVVLDFTHAGDAKQASPNGLTGVRVRVESAASVGLTGSVSLGDALEVSEVDHVAAWATSTLFWVNQHKVTLSARARERLYVRLVSVDDVRRVSAYGDDGKVQLSESFRSTVTPVTVAPSGNAMSLDSDDYDLFATGDAVVVDATGGVGGLTAGTTYYAIKVSGGTNIQLATSAANAAAGTAVNLTSAGNAADVRLDHVVTVTDGAAVQFHGEEYVQNPVTVAGGTAGRLRLNSGAFHQVFAGWDIECRIGTVDELRRVASVGETRTAAGQTVTGLSYNAGAKTFTAATGDDYRKVEPESVLVLLDNGGYVNLSVGDAYDVADPIGSSRSWKLQRDGTDITLTGGTIGVQTLTVDPSNVFAVKPADHAEYAQLATGTRMRCTNNGGFTGLVAGEDYFLIRTSANNAFQLATTRANALAGTAKAITGTGTATNIAFTTGRVGDMVWSQSVPTPEYVLDEPFSAVPAVGSTVHLVSGTSEGDTDCIVQTSTPATTTVIPLVTYDANISAAHDAEIGGNLYDVASVDATAKTVTLTTALAAAPEPGTPVAFGHRTSAFHSVSDMTVAAGASNVAELTLTYPFAALRFTATGSGSNTAKVMLAATYLPQVRVRN